MFFVLKFSISLLLLVILLMNVSLAEWLRQQTVNLPWRNPIVGSNPTGHANLVVISKELLRFFCIVVNA